MTLISCNCHNFITQAALFCYFLKAILYHICLYLSMLYVYQTISIVLNFSRMCSLIFLHIPPTFLPASARYFVMYWYIVIKCYNPMMCSTGAQMFKATLHGKQTRHIPLQHGYLYRYDATLYVYKSNDRETDGKMTVSSSLLDLCKKKWSFKRDVMYIDTLMFVTNEVIIIVSYRWFSRRFLSQFCRMLKRDKITDLNTVSF